MKRADPLQGLIEVLQILRGYRLQSLFEETNKK